MKWSPTLSMQRVHRLASHGLQYRTARLTMAEKHIPYMKGADSTKDVIACDKLREAGK